MSQAWRLMLLIVLMAAAACGSVRQLPTATPLPSTPQFFSQGFATHTPSALVMTPTPVVIPPATEPQNPTPAATPGQEGNEGNGGLVDEIINGFIIPIWNFLLTLTVGTAQALWNATGDRGGVEAQAMCCAFPIVVIALAIGRSITMQRRKK
jgi:hypothetical protein